MKQKMGKPVLFGDTVQLLHVKSGKYLTITPGILAKEERENLRVCLDVDGSPFSWLNIIPRFKIDREGDQILSGTEIYLRIAERGNEYVHAAGHVSPIQDRFREVNCSLELNSWRVHVFHSSTVLADRAILTMNELVTVSDPETKSYLTISFPAVESLDDPGEGFKGGNRQVPPELKPVESEDEERSDAGSEEEEPDTQQIVIEPMPDVVNSNAIWYIESSTLIDGGAIFWKSDLVRLKHLNSGLYLRQVMDDVEEIVDEDGNTERHCQYSTTDEPNDEGTLFRLAELLNTRSELVNRKAVQLHQEGFYLMRGDVQENLQYLSKGTTNKVSAVNMIVSRFAQREVDEEEEAEDAPEEDDDKPKMAATVNNDEARYYDSGHIEPLDVYVGVTALRYLQRYLEITVVPMTDSVSSIWPSADKFDMDFFFIMLEKLNYFSRGFPISAENLQLDVDKANPITKLRRQHQMREQRVIEIILRLINVLTPISVQSGVISNLLKFNKPVSEERLICNRLGQRVLNYCFEVIYSSVLDHPENQMYVADFMPVLLAHLSSQPLAGKCVTEMLSKNMELQETKIGSREIAIFVDQLKESRMNAMYLGLLQSCCSCEGDGVNNNQVRISNMLFNQSSDAIIQLHADYVKLSPNAMLKQESIYIPSSPVPGCPVTGNSLVTKGFPALSLTWTTNSIDYSPLGLFGKLSVPVEELYRPGAIGGAKPKDDPTAAGGKNSKMLAKRSASLEQKKAVADYFIAEMYLAAELAVDGNYVAMSKLDPLFPYEVLVTMLQMNVDDALKAAAARLLLCLHVERDPQAEIVIPRLARTWTDITAEGVPDLPYVEPARRNKFGIVQRLISEHVKGMQNSKWTLLSKPMLRVFRMLVLFNFYGSQERIEDIIVPVYNAIDRRNLDKIDTAGGKKAAVGAEDMEEVEDQGPPWQETLLEFLQSLPVLMVVLVLVAVAVSLTIWETIDPENVETNLGVIITQNIILGIFILETGSRYYCTVVVYESWTMFLQSYLNWVDIFVILIDIAFLGMPSGSGGAGGLAKSLRLLRMIRLVRILRAARVVTGIVEEISAEQAVSTYKLPSRYLKAPFHELESMGEALEILRLTQNIIDDRNLSLLLHHFCKWQDGGGGTPAEIFELVMQESEALSLHTKSSDDILIDVIMYIHPPLTQSCLDVVMAQHSVRASLIDNASNTQLLVSAKRERQLRLTDQMLRQLERNVETQELWGELTCEEDYASNKQTIDILHELIDVCRVKNTHLELGVLHVPDKEIQDLLRNLGLFEICMKVMKLLESVEEDDDGDIGEVGRNTTYLTLCANDLLYWFCLDNQQNQALAYDEMDDFLDSLDAGINSHLVIKAIFSNNEKLMRLVNRSTIENMVERICKEGHRHQYLELLSSVTNVGEKNISENQYEIVKILTQPGRFEMVSVFMCPLDSPSYAEKLELMAPFLGKKNVKMEDLPPILVYYMHLMTVLSACTVGRLNVTVVEAKIQSAFSFEDLLAGILDPRCILIAKRFMALFYFDVIIDVEMAVPSLERSVNVWKQIVSCTDVLKSTLEEVKLLCKLGVDSPEVDHVMISYGVICASILTGFFTRYFEAVNFRAYLESQDGMKLKFLDLATLLPSLHESLVQIHELKCKYLLLHDKLSFFDAIEAVGRNLAFFVPGKTAHYERLESPLEEEQANEKEQVKDISVEAAIVNKFKEFMDAITNDPKIALSVTNESRTFISKIENLPVLKNREVEGDVRFEIFIKKLVSHTKDNITNGESEKLLDGQCTATSIFFISGLRAIIEKQWGMTMEERNVSGGKAEDDRANDMINALNVCGVTSLCIDLLNVGIGEDLQIEALKLGIALLLRDGGALRIQESVLSNLIRATSVLFFKQARQLIQKLIEWSRWNGAVELEPGQDVDLPESILIIRFLQLMCVGHYKPNQDIFRDQMTGASSINLLDDMVQYLNCLSRLQCRTSTVAALQISSLILEVLQGPCEKNQEHFVLNTEIIETLNRIMRSKVTKDCVYEEELELKRNCIDIFQALLEGQLLSGVVYERVLSVIHLDVIQITYDEDPSKLTEIQKSILSESFVLLQMLCNCKPSLRYELGLAEDLVDDSLKSGTACVEVMWRGEIQRRYFHVPPVCINLAQSSKDNLVEAIDRTNSEKKLTEFLFRARELYKEVKHQQVLVDMQLNQIFSSQNYELATWLGFTLALTINILFLCYYKQDGAQKLYSEEARTIINALNIVQIIVSFFTFSLFCVVRGPVKYQIYKEAGHSTLMTLVHTATDFMTLYYFGYCVVCFLGMFHSDAWTPLLLMDVVMKNTTARDVLNAVYYPRKQLMMAFVLGIILLYMFACFNVSHCNHMHQNCAIINIFVLM